MILHNVAFVFSLLLYLYAFFPFTTKSSLAVNPPINLHEITFDGGDFLEAQFARMVFIVVDALRLDFVNSRNMPYVSAQLSGSNGCFLRVKVESPTVTLPRIKAMTSGSVPQFVDVILNLIQTETIEDSFLQRAVAKNKRLVFYGDDTWLKLYPDVFVRSEGTTSFYVNDFSEVDENVTRNVNEELEKTDWDMMFLHYLGLDHIGHVLGPYSHLIPDKLLEMDQVIQKIHEATRKTDNKTLIIVTGDHGMKDSGGHGGATFAETNVPFVILGHKCHNASIEQTDISTTISILMGLEIPQNSIGKLAKTLLNNVPYRKILYALRYNAISLKAKSLEHAYIFENATKMHYQFLKSNDSQFAQIAIDLYDNYCSLISTTLIKTSVHQNVSLLIVSCCLIVLNFTASLCSLFVKHKKCVVNEKLLLAVTVASIISVTLLNSLFCTFLLMVTVTICTIYNVAILAKNSHFERTICVFLLFGLILHALTLFSSSFVEEEHQFWYYFAGSFLFLYAYTDLKMALVVFAGLRFLRTINQTGDKWASSPDLALWFLQPENAPFLQMFLTASLIVVFICLCNTNSKRMMFLNCTILVLIFILKNSPTRNVPLGQLIWLLIFLHFVISVLKKTPLVHTWVLICTLLLKPHNVIMIPACIGASFFVRHLPASGLIFWHILLGGVLFFCQGHSNSLASINVAAGFIGLDEYRPFLVISQTILHTYGLVVLSHLSLMRQVNSITALSVILTHRMYVLMVVCITTITFRHHLFVWTVFAPKLLIETSHFMVTLIEIIVYTLFKKINKNLT